MLLDLDTTKRQWMILKVVEAPPGQGAQVDDLSFSVMPEAIPRIFTSCDDCRATSEETE
jgi:hypothetical protein